MNLNIVKDLLRDMIKEQQEIKQMLNQLLQKDSATSSEQVIQNNLTEMQRRMERVRAAKGKNTGSA
jgi:predicted lipoprotein